MAVVLMLMNLPPLDFVLMTLDSLNLQCILLLLPHCLQFYSKWDGKIYSMLCFCLPADISILKWHTSLFSILD
jgi:hypothetical protein